MDKTINNRIKSIHVGKCPKGYKKAEIGFLPSDWSVAKLSDITKEITQEAGNNIYETVSISAGIGFVNQAEKFGKELSGKQYEKYKVLHNGDFSYNKGNSNKYPQGCIYRLKDRDTAAVPNVFESFRVVDGCAEYYDQLFTSGFLNKQLSRLINHGVRDDGLLNLTSADFYSCLLPVPPLKEQEKIAEILDCYDRIIELHEKKADEYKKLKCICLSRMFPQKGCCVPEWRFPKFGDDWVQKKLGEITVSYSGGTPIVGKSEYYGGSIPFIRSGEINKDHTKLFITEKGLKNSSAAIVEKGDILYALYGATSGEVSRAKLKGAINQAILAIIPFPVYDAEFIMQWLKMKEKSIVDTYLQGGQGNLSGDIVKKLDIACPTYDEQVSIGKMFSTLDFLVTLQQHETTEYRRLKKVLSQLLLTGIVRVNK